MLEIEVIGIEGIAVDVPAADELRFPTASELKGLCALAISSAGIEATIKAEKMRGPDLTGVVAEKGADWAEKYIRHQEKLNGKEHKKEWTGKDDELKALLTWLGEQKKK